MNKALICVDVQHDFLPGGALGVDDGDEVIAPLIDLMDDVDVIVFTRDWHPEDHISFEDDGDPMYVDGSWPKHCVMGTDGAKINDQLMVAAIESDKPVLLVHKGQKRDIEQYSGFQGVVVDAWNIDNDDLRNSLLWNDFADVPVNLQEALLMLNVGDVRVGGLALDYCVKATALDSAGIGFLTSVYINATRPVAFGTGIRATLDLAHENVKIRSF